MSIRKEVLAENVTLYCGDCREVLPDIEDVDAVICDPPYGVGFKYATYQDDPASYPQLMRDVVSEVERIRGDGPAVFWQGMPNADRWHEWFPRGFRLFAACKGFVQFRPTPVQYAWDPVVFWGKPRSKPAVEKRDYHIQALAPFGAGRARVDHPCPRPLEQVAYVVDAFTAEDDCVLDPFMGSGTTGVAAVRANRRFIGIELDQTYFDTACRRIADELLRPRLFAEPIAKPVQEAMSL